MDIVEEESCLGFFRGWEEGCGTADGEKKKERTKKMMNSEIDSLILDFLKKSTLLYSICYSEIESHILELLVS